jgi:hypothetical protein
MSLRAEPYPATSSRRAFPASAASSCTVNDRWMLRPRAGPDPTTTRTSHTPGLRWRTDPVPRFDRFAADARSLQLACIPIAIGIFIGIAQDLGAVPMPG